jgi:hypothetical protein
MAVQRIESNAGEEMRRREADLITAFNQSELSAQPHHEQLMTERRHAMNQQHANSSLEHRLTIESLQARILESDRQKIDVETKLGVLFESKLREMQQSINDQSRALDERARALSLQAQIDNAKLADTYPSPADKI